MIELKNYGSAGYCMLNKETGEISFSNTNKVSEFTGVYFKDDNTFFGIYPTKKGPVVYFKGEEYAINKDLKIQLIKDGKRRKFKIENYGVEIGYFESPFIGWDVWSDEIDVDLFFMIEQKYQDQDFYQKYTLN